MKVYHQPSVRQTRRALRRMPPEPENRLWYYLRDRRLNGFKFRRQFSVGRYIVDFYCAKARIAIEIDGDSHFTQEAQEYDREREIYIKACGITILRFTNEEVQKNIEGVLEKIAESVLIPPHPQPFSSLEEKGANGGNTSPQAGRGRPKAG